MCALLTRVASTGWLSAVLLAMSAGAAVIASDVGGLPEIVHHRETGMLVENTPQAVGGAMRTLLDNPGLSSEIARRARKLVEQEFTIGRMVTRTMEVYRQVLS